MKLITYILLFTSLIAFSNDADSLFTVGNYHYDNEAYQKAIESYLAIESDEQTNAVYHNLGNCYYQTGNITKSILFYERALLLKKDSQTQDNLNLAKKRIQKIESIPKLFFIGWWNSIAQFLNYNSWLVLACIFLWISCVLLFLFLKNRQKLIFNLFLTVKVFTILLVLVSLKSNDLSRKKYAVVMKKTAILSNTSDSKTKQIINPGNKVEIINSKGNIYLVVLPNGQSGWLSQSDLEVI